MSRRSKKAEHAWWSEKDYRRYLQVTPSCKPFKTAVYEYGDEPITFTAKPKRHGATKWCISGAWEWTRRTNDAD